MPQKKSGSRLAARASQEMRRSFSLWDAENAGGLAMEQLQEILKRHLGPKGQMFWAKPLNNIYVIMILKICFRVI